MENKNRKKKYVVKMTDLHFSKMDKRKILEKNERMNQKKNQKNQKKNQVSKNNSKTWIPRKGDDELEDSFEIRESFFELNQPTSYLDYTVMNSLSQILSNILFLHVRYAPNIEQKLKEILMKNNRSIFRKYGFLSNYFPL